MNKILLIIFMSLTLTAYECKLVMDNGAVYKTMSSTYSENGDIKSMWFQYTKTVKKKAVETAKDKIEVKDKDFRTAQSISYDAKGNSKNHFVGNSYDNFNEPIPQSVGEWKRNMVNVGSYLLDDMDAKLHDRLCALFDSGWLPTDENGTIVPPLHNR